jgi:hypothetical protein
MVHSKSYERYYNVWGKCKDVVHILTTELYGAKNKPGLEIKGYTLLGKQLHSYNRNLVTN